VGLQITFSGGYALHIPQEDVVKEIEALIRRIQSDPEGSVVLPKANVVSWIKHEDVEVLGAAYALLLDFGSRVEVNPPLDAPSYLEFILRYWGKCLTDDPHGEWADSRYEAGWSIVADYVAWWDDPRTPKEFISGIKQWLADMYTKGDADIRTCIVCATLEHLFEHNAIAEFFADWKRDPDLVVAYDEAMRWSENGGSSPWSEMYTLAGRTATGELSAGPETTIRVVP
jgi:hypothetical protein